MTPLERAPLPATAYDPLLRSLHWGMALLILATFLLGLTVDAFPRAWEPAIVLVHKDIGIAILLLLLVRIAWRLTHRAPPATDLSPLMGRLAGGGHLALYLLMVAVPFVGIGYSVLRGQSFDFGLFSIGPFMPGDRAAARPLREVHELAAYALLGLAALHALIALWHHFIRRDGVLRRMLAKA